MQNRSIPMREIKFRAWIKDSWLYEKEEDNPMIYNWQDTIFVESMAFQPDDIPIMQYTGLKDRTGREIYEGDIVESKLYPFYTDEGRNYLGVIEWFDGDACWYLDMRVVSDRVRGYAVGGMLSEYRELEVIGNIYENPELLQ